MRGWLICSVIYLALTAFPVKLEAVERARIGTEPQTAGDDDRQQQDQPDPAGGADLLGQRRGGSRRPAAAMDRDGRIGRQTHHLVTLIHASLHEDPRTIGRAEHPVRPEIRSSSVPLQVSHLAADLRLLHYRLLLLKSRFTLEAVENRERYLQAPGIGVQHLGAVFSNDSIVSDQRRWNLVLARLKAAEMPPSQSRQQPTSAQRQAVVDWIEAVG